MKQITPIDAALELIETLDGKPNRSDVEDWLLQGLKRYRSGYMKTLDDSLGLSVGPGQARDKLCYVWRTRERNRLIRAAAGNLTPDYGRVRTARLIEFAMNTAIPDIRIPEKFPTVVLLCRLRQICMNHEGDSKMALSWKRTLEIMNGDGC